MAFVKRRGAIAKIILDQINGMAIFKLPQARSYISLSRIVDTEVTQIYNMKFSYKWHKDVF